MEYNPFSAPEDDEEQLTADESSPSKKKKRRLKMSLADIVETSKAASEKVEKKRPFSFSLPEFIVKKDDTAKVQEETKAKLVEKEQATDEEESSEEITIIKDETESKVIAANEEDDSVETQEAPSTPIIELDPETEPLLPQLPESDPEVIAVESKAQTQHESDFHGEITIPHSDARFFHDIPETLSTSEVAPESVLETSMVVTDSMGQEIPSLVAEESQAETVALNVAEGAINGSEQLSPELETDNYMTDEERQFLLTTAPHQNAQFVNPNTVPIVLTTNETVPEQQTTIVKRGGFWQGAILGWMFGRRGKKKALEASKLKLVKLEKDKREAEDYASALFAENAHQKEALETKAALEVQAPVEKDKVIENIINIPQETMKDETKQELKTELRTSAWHSYEVNPITGALVEKTQLEYGSAFEQETKHEAFIEPKLEYDTETSVLSKTQDSTEINLQPIESISSETAEFLKDRSRQELVRFTTHRISSNMTNGSLWALGFVIAVVVVIILL